MERPGQRGVFEVAALVVVLLVVFPELCDGLFRLAYFLGGADCLNLAARLRPPGEVVCCDFEQKEDN